MGSTFVANDRSYRIPSRPVLAICADGWDPAYVEDAFERSLMPRLGEAIAGGGSYLIGRAQVPTFTNPNNVAIVTGVSAARNGIAGNHYRDEHGAEVQVTDASFLRATTIHAAAMSHGVGVLCVTAKDKLRALLSAGGAPAFSAECAHEQRLADGTPLLDVVGAPNPDIYDWRLSPYTIDLALALAARLEARLVYASLTDFVQHAAAPGEPMADDLYRAVDAAIGRAIDAGFVVGLAADHGMRDKSHPDGSPNVRFLDEALTAAGVRGAHTLCPITDPYVVHHAALGSLAWVHLDDLGELEQTRGALAALPGVEAVLDRVRRRRGVRAPRRPHRRRRRARRRRHRAWQVARRPRPGRAPRDAALARQACTSARCRSSSPIRWQAAAFARARRSSTATSMTCF